MFFFIELTVLQDRCFNRIKLNVFEVHNLFSKEVLFTVNQLEKSNKQHANKNYKINIKHSSQITQLIDAL